MSNNTKGLIVKAALTEIHKFMEDGEALIGKANQNTTIEGNIYVTTTDYASTATLDDISNQQWTRMLPTSVRQLPTVKLLILH